MLVKAQEAHSNDVGLHEFCTSETHRSKDALTNYGDRTEKAQADLDKLSAEADQATAKIADLHAGIADTQRLLATNASARAQEHAAYDRNKAELENTEGK